MTPEQQLQQLLTEAEQVTAKMREALAKMETPPAPAPLPSKWIPKKRDLAKVISVDISDINAGIKVGDVVQIDEEGTDGLICIRSNGERRVFYYNQLRHLPDYQPQPKLATTYEEVAEAVRPTHLFDSKYYVVKSAAKQDAAFRQIKNLEAYCAERFEGERDSSIIVLNGNLCKDYKKHAPFHFSKESADFVIQHFPEIFKTYYGVE